MKLANSQEATEQAADIIKNGGLIAFRTDTFYGLGVDPFNAAAVHRIVELKGREANKPILVLISGESQISNFIVEQSPLFTAVARRFWPGPLTIIGQAHPELPKELTAGSGTIGLRLPDDEHVRNLVRSCGGALTATSANPSNRPSARSAKEVQDYFATGIDLILDAGTTTAGKPSTVLDLSNVQPRLVREGAISRGELKDFL
ncbi:MAG: L-threonylcarbamoyladenylate synthase [Pyrinomonadaceae bacterium]